MDYKKLKGDIEEITAIAASVPDPFKEKCFELLLQNLLRGEKPAGAVGEGAIASGVGEEAPSEKVPIPGQVRLFIQRTGVTEEELNSIMMYEHGEIHFIHEPSPKTLARGQIEWSLLLALKNGILTNNFVVDPEEVRSICQDKGYYSQANFAANFKKTKTAKLFKKPPEAQGDPQPLSPDGQQELAKLVKSLAG